MGNNRNVASFLHMLLGDIYGGKGNKISGKCVTFAQVFIQVNLFDDELFVASGRTQPRRGGARRRGLPRLLPQGRVVVLTDRNVARCRPELFEGCDPICMEPGEEHKTLQTVEAVCRELIRRGADRTTFLLGVGGDRDRRHGFVASVYMRGVPFGFVSTTLLGCVDASVGGKNGVNLDGYKKHGGRFRPAAIRRLRHVALRDASPAGDSRRTGRGGQGGDHRRRTALPG